jgi:hypothetical protein
MRHVKCHVSKENGVSLFPSTEAIALVGRLRPPTFPVPSLLFSPQCEVGFDCVSNAGCPE